MRTLISRKPGYAKAEMRTIVGLMSQQARSSALMREGYDIVINWGNMNPPILGTPAPLVINTPDAIRETSDKAGFREKLAENELCTPIYRAWEDVPQPMVPLIMRPKRHSKGLHCYLVENMDEFGIATAVCPGFYAAEYIPKVAEYRVFCASGRVFAVAVKCPEDKTALVWNHSDGDVLFDNVNWDNWPLSAVRRALEAFLLSSLDFGAVDVMVGPDGRVHVLEINSACAITSEYRQEKFASVFDYFITHGKERIPLIEAKGGYLKFIHPAVCERAKVV